uniref:Uncharacterized protein n=1 Tax=Timema shepardi TaxID=629360 RepID=A0A7R9FUW6_TIMSH|nr:unnamed protein product [Timema shepardi]
MRPVGEELSRQNMNTNSSQTPSSNLRPYRRSIAVDPSEPPLLSASSTSPRVKLSHPLKRREPALTKESHPGVAQLSSFRTLSRALLLDIIDALADDKNDTKMCQDLSCTSLNSEC